MAREPVIRVVFVDALTGQEISRTRLPLSRLPQSFEVATQLQIGAEAWSVVGAEPPTAAEFAATGRLRVLLTRGRLAPPDGILYSLPTICDLMPVPDGPPTPDPYAMHEDDWRQAEFVERGHTDAVDAELAAIRAVYSDHGRTDEQGRVYAFDALHLRRRPAVAITQPWPLAELVASLPTPTRTYDAVSFGPGSGTVPESFALAFGPVVIYGLARTGRVGVLGLRTSGLAEDGGRLAGAVARLMRGHDLILVDWPRCLTLTAEGVSEYI